MRLETRSVKSYSLLTLNLFRFSMGWFHSVWYDVPLWSIYWRFVRKIRFSFGDSSRRPHFSVRTLADVIHRQSLRHVRNIRFRLGVWI